MLKTLFHTKLLFVQLYDFCNSIFPFFFGLGLLNLLPCIKPMRIHSLLCPYAQCTRMAKKDLILNRKRPTICCLNDIEKKTLQFDFCFFFLSCISIDTIHCNCQLRLSFFSIFIFLQFFVIFSSIIGISSRNISYKLFLNYSQSIIFIIINNMATITI